MRKIRKKSSVFYPDAYTFMFFKIAQNHRPSSRTYEFLETSKKKQIWLA